MGSGDRFVSDFHALRLLPILNDKETYPSAEILNCTLEMAITNLGKYIRIHTYMYAYNTYIYNCIYFLLLSQST